MAKVIITRRLCLETTCPVIEYRTEVGTKINQCCPSCGKIGHMTASRIPTEGE